MGEVSTIGLDIAKSVFQVHGVDVDGAVVMRKRISRAKLLEFFASLPACLVGIEACPSAHYWSRRPAAKRDWAASRNRAIDTCAGCSSPAPWPSSDMHANTAQNGLGSLV